MEWTTAASLAARIAKGSYDNRHFLQKLWKHTQARLDFGETQIVVTGHANVGKTLLIKQMTGEARELDFSCPKSLSVETQAVTLGEWTKLTRVLPGQIGVRDIGEIDAFYNNKSLEGVIHVVDFGYTLPRELASSENLFLSKNIKTIEELRKKNLANEIQTLKDTLSTIRKSIAKNSRPKWLIIAVNKVDLFFDDRISALDFYHPGGKSAFSDALNEFLAHVGKANLPVYVIQTCASDMDFTWNNTTIVSNLKNSAQNSILQEFIAATAIITESHQ